MAEVRGPSPKRSAARFCPFRRMSKFEVQVPPGFINRERCSPRLISSESMEKPTEKPTEVAALLLCPIHLQLFEDPVLCPCGHTFCRRCIVVEINASGKCPFDGTTLQASSLFPNQIIAEEVRTYLRNGGSLSPAPKPVRCSFESYGCEWKVQRFHAIHDRSRTQGPAEALSTHLSNCDYEKMKDFILKKERESSQLREEVKSKDEQIAQLRHMLSANSSLQADLQRILKLALSLATQGKTAIERGVGQLAGHLAKGWHTVTDEKAYRELSASMEQTAVRCANSVKNVIITIQQASKHVSDSELLTKLLAQVRILPPLLCCDIPISYAA